MATRRRVLAGLGLGLAAPGLFWRGAGSGGRAVSGPGAAEPGALYRATIPLVGTDGPRPSIELSLRNPYQGGAVYVRVANATAGSARIFGRVSPLSPGAGGLEGFVGIGVGDPPGPTTVEVMATDAVGGSFRFVEPVTVRQTQWTYDDIWLPPPDPDAPPSDEPPLEPEQPRLDALYARVTPRRWELPFIIPIELGGDVWVSGYFGEQRSFNGGPRTGHHGGTDIAAPTGTPVRATNHGTVVMSELTLVRGNLVVVDHGGGVLSCYGHLSERTAEVGAAVRRGDVVGLVGSTGLSSGPHLHWELSVAGVLVDGLRWLDGTQGF
ncbi:MAG: hypothetical protein KatS3mg062_0513 [Tepidiforma sp.]|nr:MAG: hypothetical protein KatS3mg062_0513 [Tepidiforma sp.]